MDPINKIMFGIGAAIILIIAVVFIWLSIANAHLKTELAQAQANGTACHLANDEFTAKVAEQNRAVMILQAQGALREKRAQQAALAAQKTARAYFLAAAKLRALRPRGDACQSADELFKSYLDAAK